MLTGGAAAPPVKFPAPPVNPKSSNWGGQVFCLDMPKINYSRLEITEKRLDRRKIKLCMKTFR